MTTRTTFDNNFLDKLAYTTPDVRRKLLERVEFGALEFYANYEALREVVGLATTARKSLIVPFAKDILALTKGRILNEIEPMLASELRGTFELQLPEGRRREIVTFLEQAAAGHVPDAAQVIGQGALAEKQSAKIRFNAMFQAFEAHFGSLGDAERAKITFEQVQAGWWSKKGRETVLRFCHEWGVPEPEQTADRVMAHPEHYPHVRTWARIFALGLHRYLVLRRKRHEGDLFDLWQMLYLQDMDVYITNEKKLPEWYREVFGGTRRVVTAEGFFAQL